MQPHHKQDKNLAVDYFSYCLLLELVGVTVEIVAAAVDLFTWENSRSR